MKEIQMPQPNPKWWLVILVGLVTVTSLYFLNRTISKDTSQPTAIEVAQVNPEVIKEKKVEATLETPKKTIRVLPSTSKGLITLPKDVIGDTNRYVTASSLINSKEQRQVVTQVLDVTTGDTETFISEAPQPWVALENRGQLSVDYGYKSGNSNPVGRINLRQDVVQLKSLHLGVSLSGYTDGDYFAGVGGGIRW